LTSEERITRELSLGDVISKSFGLYRRDFLKYFLLFLVVDTVAGIAVALAVRGFNFATLPSNPTPEQLSSWWSSALGALAYFVLVIILTFVLTALADAVTIRMASDVIEGHGASFGSALKFGASKLISVFVLILLVSIIVGLGFILIIPGIILAIMFSLAVPALVIENVGIVGSLGRSRELVGHRWLKTFATFLVIFVVIIAIEIVVSVLSLAFGGASVVVSSALGAVAAPLVPIALTVYFYSNRARIAPLPVGQVPGGYGPSPQPGMKFCPNCGTRLPASAAFCSTCGAKQPTQV
jgi:hypothetical protein